MATVELKFTFKVSEEGKITIVNSKEFQKQMREQFLGKQVIATFRKPKKIRSTKQNSFYWAVTVPEVLEALVGAGYDRHMLSIETVHEYLTDKFLKVDLPSSEYSGEFITITKRSKDLSTAEFMDYMVDISRWSSEFLGVILSVPDEQKEINYL